MRPYRITNRDAAVYVEHRIEFTGSNTSGRWVYNTWGANPYGSLLPGEHAEELARVVALGLVYVVKSYDTPVAWWSESEGWSVPPVKFSPTTSKHVTQMRLRSL